jgi:anti-sigma regulatory factor (Ser/Thr protein kinase)
MSDQRSFPRRSESIGQARRFVREVLGDGPPETIEAAELMVSELATNSVQHAQSAFEITIAGSGGSGGSLRVEVRDCGAGEPTLRSPTPREPRGRGLRIVEALSTSWGIDPGPTGKTVWFTMPRRPQSSDRGSRRANAA